MSQGYSGASNQPRPQRGYESSRDAGFLDSSTRRDQDYRHGNMSSSVGRQPQPMFGSAAHPLALPKPQHKKEEVGSVMVVCPEEDAKSHGYSLYGLVKPASKGDGVESAAGMVNVIPRKRIYLMTSTDELETFRDEILKRPLVLQPTIKTGTGVQKLGCFLKLTPVNWVVMINQKHPKIFGTIMEGVDAAKAFHKRGQPYIIEFLFSEILRNLYFPAMSKGARKKFQYMDCVNADLIIRYSGDTFHQGVKWQVKSQHVQFSFDKVHEHEIVVRSVKQALLERESPIIQIIPENELQQILPGWGFEQTPEVEEEEYIEEEDEELNAAIAASREDYQHLVPKQQVGRVRGRQNRSRQQGGMQEVSVELHAPGSPSKEIPHGQDSRYHYDVPYFPEESSENYADSYHDKSHDYRMSSNHQQQSVSQQKDSYQKSSYHQLQPKEVGANVYDKLKLPAKTEVLQQHQAKHTQQGSGRSNSSAADSGYEGEMDAGFSDRSVRPKYGNKYMTSNSSHLTSNGYNYDNPGFDANDNYELVEDSVERNKAMAARLLNMHTPQKDNRRSQESNFRSHHTGIATISRNGEHEGGVKDSYI